MCIRDRFNRSFKAEYYEKTNWLCGCDKRNSLFCFPRLLFGGNPWTKFGMKDINHLAEKIRNHQATSIHIKNAFQFSLFSMYSSAAGQ